LGIFRSFGGEAKQLMTYQTEYYQFAIKFLNDSEYTHVVPEGKEMLNEKKIASEK